MHHRFIWSGFDEKISIVKYSSGFLLFRLFELFQAWLPLCILKSGHLYVLKFTDF